ncbi:MAG: MBL fold metallo-hydrolase [Flavobacterium sp.]|nr:MAG: MBL fold metallo-hydrolase [Flavobacterium sp.]
MKTTIFHNNTERFSLLFLLLLSLGFNATAQNQKTQVFHIQNYFTEAYLVKGNSEKLVLIETGVPVPGYQDSLVNSIKKLGFKPENISLAIVTHGHGDHAGNARFLQQTYKIKIAGSKADLDKFSSGKTELSKSEDVSIWGTRLRPYTDLNYQPFTPDVLIENTVDLSKYGVNGKIIPIKGGHTPGDLLVLIGDNLFVGDAFLGTFKAQGGGLAPDNHHVREHFYHENKQLADQNLKVIEKIALENNVKTLYPTHNGPVSVYEFTKYIKEEPLLRLLSKQENDLLSDIVKGKSDLTNQYLASNFVLQSVDGNDYNKKDFIEKYITNPKEKIESLTAEDFRIVSSNENTAVLTYIEVIKLQGKDAKNVSVIETYLKDKNGWKLVYKKGIN